MIKITHICDKCGAEQDTGDQMWYIGISIASGAYTEKVQDKKYYCRMCAEGFGLLPPTKHKDKGIELPKPPTIEDLIREIVRSEQNLSN